jgi:hypothetical protein
VTPAAAVLCSLAMAIARATSTSTSASRCLRLCLRLCLLSAAVVVWVSLCLGPYHDFIRPFEGLIKAYY